MRHEPFTVVSRGLRLAGDLYLPESLPAAGVPATVVGSGFGGVKEMLLAEYGQALATAGVACLAIDYPNFGASEGPRRQHIDPPAFVQAYTDALAALAADPRIDSNRLGVWGPSLAGGVTLVVAARHPLVRSAVAIVPYIRVPRDRPDLALSAEVVKDVIGRVRGKAPRMVPVAGPPGTLAAMNADGAQEWMTAMAASAPLFRNEVTTASMLAMLRWSTASSARRVAVPLQVVLADDDTITPPRLVRKAVRERENVSYLSFPETHFELLTKYNDQVRQAVVDWFTKTLS